ncbi:hypothetical protein RFI_30391 [Reticulomyxa filosa]|uniref:Uncharacterized protein n=1 Tax=Reticulomyxa filosa TaxID=46433 RepID=X6LYL0_RETFI|nr:hypothetical protein RFI_30391 [Reticulomyxa filosa]|eukprot:ETO07003.1 hypothetical protein RFI_30391 [Reticulomyxa filosa]
MLNSNFFFVFLFLYEKYNYLVFTFEKDDAKPNEEAHLKTYDKITSSSSKDLFFVIVMKKQKKQIVYIGLSVHMKVNEKFQNKHSKNTPKAIKYRLSKKKKSKAIKKTKTK